MRASATLVCLLLAGCSDDEPDQTPPRLPTVFDLGGPRMAHPQLVSIFYSDDPDVAALTAYSEWLVTSSWLEQVGAEYGIGAGSILRVVQRSEAAPALISGSEIVDMLFQGLADGSLPPPPGEGPGEVLYVVHLPPQTGVTSSGSVSCRDFGGYHASARRNRVELAYAVVPTCPGYIRDLTDLEVREFVTSHEVIEAATDPVPANHPAFQLRDPTGSWSALGDEVADLCTRSDPTGVWYEAGFVAQRSWSNAAGATGDPCVPVASDAPYFNVRRDGNVLPRIPPGGRGTVSITGWATGATADWAIMAITPTPNDATLALATSTLGADRTTKIDITVSPATPPGSTLQIFVYSSLSQTSYHLLPMIAIIGDPCAAFTTCEDCSSHIGCGFCTSTGRCQPDGLEGSADGSCPASSFARWPGSCGGFCGGHNGSCTDCTAQAGCGWCATGGGRCLEASADFAGPAGTSCAYADWAFTPQYCSR